MKTILLKRRQSGHRVISNSPKLPGDLDMLSIKQVCVLGFDSSVFQLGFRMRVHPIDKISQEPRTMLKSPDDYELIISAMLWDTRSSSNHLAKSLRERSRAPPFPGQTLDDATQPNNNNYDNALCISCRCTRIVSQFKSLRDIPSAPRTRGSRKDGAVHHRCSSPHSRRFID